MKKPATLELAYVGARSAPQGTIALYASVNPGSWQRVGGTVNAAARRISAPISRAGRYALFEEPRPFAGTGRLSLLSLTPRVFSPRANYASRDVAIGFSLGRSGEVTVKVFNRAGRLVKEVAKAEAMGAGSNLVRWDGTNRDGAVVEDGLYLVMVEALGERQELALAVVR